MKRMIYYIQFSPVLFLLFFLYATMLPDGADLSNLRIVVGFSSILFLSGNLTRGIQTAPALHLIISLTGDWFMLKPVPLFPVLR